MLFSYRRILQFLIVFALLVFTTSGSRAIKNARKKRPNFSKGKFNVITIAPKNETKVDKDLLLESSQRETNYELLGGGFEGDMHFPKGFNPVTAGQERGVAIAGPRPWPSNTVPYDLSYISSPSHQSFIVQAMEKLMYAVATPVPGQTSRKRCVSFRPRTASDRYFVTITYGSGCSGTVGYFAGSDMRLTLQNPGCFSSGIIQHELLHILGFYHEQSRPDRDSYVNVYYQNIQAGTAYNFDRYVWGRDVLNQNTPYDLQSIMHYDAYAFSRNGEPTILARQSGAPLGQRVQLSPTDIAEVRNYYGC